MLQVIHISDTHLGPTPDFEVRGACPHARLERLVEGILGLDFTPDFVIHTGDVANDPHPDAYRLAAAQFARFPCPVYSVVGNHDAAAMMRGALVLPPAEPLASDPDRLAYRFDRDGVRFFVLDARMPDPEEPHGVLPEPQLEALTANLAAWTGPFAVLLHFPPFPIGSPWIDKFLALRNGEALHRAIVNAGPARCRGVFFGHLHRGIQIYRDGILYAAVSSPACQFSAGTRDERVAFDPECPLPFNHLTFTADGTIVKEHVLNR